MMMNLLSALSLTNGLPFLKCFSRCYDRGCRFSLRRRQWEGAKNDDGVYTRQAIQSEMQRLYENPIFKSYFIYAQLYNVLFVCLMYSSGIPALYGIGCVFFFVSYWIAKTLIVKFSRKTIFEDYLQEESLGYVKYAILIHFMIGGVMYSNSRLFSSE